MAVLVSIASGHDVEYVLRGAGGGGERTSGGYYINATQQGEAPGQWFGRGAEALGLAPGSEVDHEVYRMVYAQVDPRTGAKLGRSPGRYDSKRELLARLRAAEPYATAERVHELERMAAQQHRQAHPYTDVTVSFSKSLSVVHASIRENARRARLAGRVAEAARWDAIEGRFAAILQDANRAGLEHLQRWAATRTGYHGRRIDGQEPGKYEAAGLVVSSWLQGTSRDGDPHDHVHNVVARMCQTDSDGRWRAVDTMAVRAQAGAVKAIADAYVQSAMAREFGIAWEPGDHQWGNEVRGVSREQRDAYSSRGQEIDRKVREAARQWSAHHGRAPNRAELRRIHDSISRATRGSKEPGRIDWDAQAAVWDAQLGGDLARIARDLGLGGGGAVPAQRTPPDGAPGAAAQTTAVRTALARVQEKHSTWTRGQLCGEIAACLPADMGAVPPHEAARLVGVMADRALAGEAGQVLCLEAPEWPPLPAALRRDLDGRSVYTRPGTERYATQVQIRREEVLLAQARGEGAPHLAREEAAWLLHSDPRRLDAQLRESMADSRAIQPSGLTAAQAAAAYHALTSPRRVDILEAPAGAGKTHTLAAVAHAWRDAGRPVFGTGPSQTAVNVLAAEVDIPVWNTAQLLGHLPGRRGALGALDFPPGTLLVVDEGSMTSIPDAADLVRLAHRRGWKVVIAGDRDQLTAVESGGGFALLSDELGRVQLPDPVRFTERWEQDASLLLRAGDAAVLSEYADHGRVRGAPPEQVMDDARRAYVAAVLAGEDPLLMAQSNRVCADISQRIRSDLRHLGIVGQGEEVELRDKVKASAGDLIILRKNHHDDDSGEEGRGLANGDTLRIESVEGHRVMVRRLLDSDPETGARRFTNRAFEFTFLKESELAYAVTTHRAQGRTVTTSTALVTGGEAHEWLYVAMTRGRLGNYAYVFTIAANPADPSPGTRAAPELTRWERSERERAGLDGAVPLGPASADALAEALGVLSDMAERPGREPSAVQLQRDMLANADHLGKLHAIWTGETAPARTERYERELRAALPEPYRDAPRGGTGTWLWRTLRDAEAAGLDAGQVLRDAVAEKPLDGARDAVAVVDARIREKTAGMVPLSPRPWAEQVPDLADPERREYVTAVARAMDGRKERLGEHAAETSPEWAARALGPVPDEPLDRLEWQHRASAVAAYREQFGYEHETDAIGPEPVNSPDARAAWHGAFAALGPADGPDLRAEPDGRLHLMRGTYGNTTKWAPRYVADELRLMRVGVRDAGLTRVRATAEGAVAHDQGDAGAAARHEAVTRSSRAMEEWYRSQEAALATTMDTRREWERSTEGERRLAVAADAELRRRHPDEQLPALRSAEPEPPSPEEQADLWPHRDPGVGRSIDPDVKHETPQWVTDMAARNQAAREELDRRASERIPDEDPDYADLGDAWPGVAERERDAILQAVRPRIDAAPEVQAGRDAEAGE